MALEFRHTKPRRGQGPVSRWASPLRASTQPTGSVPVVGWVGARSLSSAKPNKRGNGQCIRHGIGVSAHQTSAWARPGVPLGFAASRLNPTYGFGASRRLGRARSLSSAKPNKRGIGQCIRHGVGVSAHQTSAWTRSGVSLGFAASRLNPTYGFGASRRLGRGAQPELREAQQARYRAMHFSPWRWSFGTPNLGVGKVRCLVGLRRFAPQPNLRLCVRVRARAYPISTS
jgi:hypothetical protein